MRLYDGASEIKWKYEGVKSAQQMRAEGDKRALFEVPCVLFDNGTEDVVGFETVADAAARFCVPNTGDPQETVDSMNAVVAGTYKAPGVEQAQQTADEAKAIAEKAGTAAASVDEYMDAILGLDATDETEATDAE